MLNWLIDNLYDVTHTFRGLRGDEIKDWLDKHTEVENYVIIDDLDAGNFNEHQIPRLLIVNPIFGLDEYTAERAIRKLNGNL